MKVRWQHAVVALTLAAGFIIVSLLLIILSPPAVIDAAEGSATIHLVAERSVIGFPGECLNVTWHVDQIRAVFLNDEGVVGEGSQHLCIIADQPPTLRVELQDGREVEYVLPVYILAQQPLFWLLPGGALLLFIVGLYALIPTRGGSGAGVSTPAGGVAGKILLGLLSIVVTLAILEIGLRVYFGTTGTKDQRIRYLYSAAEIDALDPLVDPLPYINYYPSPRHPEHNTLGYRGPEITLPRPETTYRIVALGGSTTYSTGTDSEHSYPALLQKVLREDYGYSNVEVVNAGFQGYTSWESLVNFALRVLEIEPNMIILYDSYNDLITREQASVDCYRGYNALRGLNYTRGLWTEREDLSPSVLLRVIGINLGWMRDPLAFGSGFTLPKVACEPDPLSITPEERLAANPPVYLRRNLRNTIVLAQANQVQPVLSTWVYYDGIDRPAYWRDAVEDQNQLIRDLGAEMDTPVIDLPATFPVDASLWEGDGIHLVASGTLVQAQQYAAFLDESGLLPHPENQ